MRPRKSSTLIKKSQHLIQSKQSKHPNTFSVNQSNVSQLHSNSLYNHSFQTAIKGKFEVKGSLNKGSINPTSAFRNTFSRAKNDHISNDHKKLQTPELTNKKLLFLPEKSEEFTQKQSFYEEQAPQIKQQKIPKTKVGFYQSVKKINGGKPQGKNSINPEQKSSTTKKVSSSGKRQSLLNTRKSKLQSEVKKKQAIQMQEKQKSLVTPLKKSKNINIHTIKNSSTIKNTENSSKCEVRGDERSVKVEKDQKQKKEESQIQEYRTETELGIKREQEPQKITQVQSHRLDTSVRRIQRQTQSHETVQLINNRVSEVPQPNEPISHRLVEISRPINQTEQNSSPFNRNQTQSSINSFTQSEIESLRQPQNLSPSQQSLHSPNIQPSQNQGDNQRSLNLSALIANTQDIIEFINRLNLRARAQAFDLMVGQLMQLNMIAQQVQELGQIGNNLGYSLVNVFGTRIRELQTTIINQVGQALIASFQQRIDPQFEALVIREPSLRQGFSKSDIERVFEEKITFEEAECSICLDNVKPGDTLIELQCFHQYHPICIRTWLENSRKCPMCRMEQKL